MMRKPAYRLAFVLGAASAVAILQLPGRAQAPVTHPMVAEGTPADPPILPPLTNRVPNPCPAAPPPATAPGPNMSEYSANRENELASANALVNCHDYAGAYALYLKVLEKYPDDARALMMAGEDAIRAGRLEDSVPLLEGSLTHSANPRTHLADRYTYTVRDLLMRLYIRLGRWQDLEAQRLEARKASLAGDTSLPADKGYAIEQFNSGAAGAVDTIEFPAMHGENQTREQFIFIEDMDHCTGFTPHIDLDSPGGGHVFSLDAYSSADARTRLNSYPDGEPSYQTIRKDVLAALSQGQLVSYRQHPPCSTGPVAGGQMPAVTFHLQKQGGSPWPLKLIQLSLDGHPVALDSPTPVSGMWMRSITLVLQNNSPKNVVLAGVTLTFTDTGTGQSASPYMSLPIVAGGYPENAFLQADGTNRAIPAGRQGTPIHIPPGGMIELSTNAGTDQVQSAAYEKAPISTIELDEGTVYFDDGSKWSSGGYWVHAPLPQVWKMVTPEEFSIGSLTSP